MPSSHMCMNHHRNSFWHIKLMQNSVNVNNVHVIYAYSKSKEHKEHSPIFFPLEMTRQVDALAIACLECMYAFA